MHEHCETETSAADGVHGATAERADFINVFILVMISFHTESGSAMV